MAKTLDSMAPSLTKRLQLQVFSRGGWHCTYCKQPIFFSPALKLLEELSPGHGYYDGNGRRGAMLAQLENQCACCDHVVPASRAGETSITNLVAACFACNRAKSDGPAPETEGNETVPRPPAWDGFVSLYPELPGANADWCRAINDRASWESV